MVEMDGRVIRMYNTRLEKIAISKTSNGKKKESQSERNIVENYQKGKTGGQWT